AIDNTQMDGVVMLKQERRTAIHAPTGEVKPELQRRLFALSRQPRRRHFSKVTVAMLPGPIAVMRLPKDFPEVGADFLVDHGDRHLHFKIERRPRAPGSSLCESLR